MVLTEYFRIKLSNNRSLNPFLIREVVLTGNKMKTSTIKGLNPFLIREVVLTHTIN